METKQIFKSQYRATAQMLRSAVEGCPDSLWNDERYKNPFWHIAFHAIFFTHFYLHSTEEDFIPWEKHKWDLVSLGNDPGNQLLTKEEIIEYLDHFEERLGELVDQIDLEADSGFSWLPFGKLQLQLYNLRHFQHHTGELCERLGQEGEIEVEWIGRVAS